MNEIEFNKSLRELNKKYYALFGTIPCITDYSCTREEYTQALSKAVEENVNIDTLLKKAGAPTFPGAIN